MGHYGQTLIKLTRNTKTNVELKLIDLENKNNINTDSILAGLYNMYPNQTRGTKNPGGDRAAGDP